MNMWAFYLDFIHNSKHPTKNTLKPQKCLWHSLCHPGFSSHVIPPKTNFWNLNRILQFQERLGPSFLASYCWWFWNPVNSPVEVGSWNPIIHKVLAPSQVVGNGISEPSTVCLFFILRGNNIPPWKKHHAVWLGMFLGILEVGSSP